MRLKTFLRKCLCCLLMLGLALWQIGCAETASTPMGGKPTASGTSKPTEKSDDDNKGKEAEPEVATEKPAVEQAGSTTGPGLGAEVPEPAAEKPAEEAKPAEKSEEKPKEE